MNELYPSMDQGENLPEAAVDEESDIKIEPENIGVNFDPKVGTLLLGLGGIENLAPNLLEDISKLGFTPKAELHLTIIGYKQGNMLKRVIIDNPELAEKIAILAQSIDWNIQSTKERYMLTKQYNGEDTQRQSIIEMVICLENEDFINQLNTITGLNLEEQPPHVTVATKGNPQGIGINTYQDIVSLGEKLN